MSNRQRLLKATARPRLAQAWAQTNAAKKNRRLSALPPAPDWVRPRPAVPSETPADASVRVRWSEGIAEHDLSELRDLPLEWAQPFRGVTHHNQALNSVGLVPMTKVQSVLLTESKVERMVAMLIDFRGGYTGISSQPFEIHLGNGLSHIPDFAVRMNDGSLVVVDVRPRSRMDNRTLDAFEVTDALLGSADVHYSIVHELTLREEVNLRFLSAFGSRPRFWRQCRPTLLQLAAAGGTVTWKALREELDETFGLGSLWLQPVIGHAVWTGLLSVDLGHRVNDMTRLTWTPQREQGTIR
jgi:hypothetical protein